MDIIDKARKLLSDFIKEEVLRGKTFDTNMSEKDFIQLHLKELLNFSFWKIENKPKYVYSDLLEQKSYKIYKDIDGDRITISYIIYYLLWDDKLDINLESFLKYKTHETCQEYFSGDTICTFNTLFGGKNIPWFIDQDFNQLKINRDKIKNDSINIFNNDELKEINKFRLKYQTIPNFYPLPCITYNKKSINSFRGDISDEGWHDYFDTFLNNLEASLDKNKVVNLFFQKLIELNEDIFFKEYNTRKAFVELFYLEPFDKLNFNEEEKKAKRGESEHYKEFALNYIKEVTKCINERSKILETKLRVKIDEKF